MSRMPRTPVFGVRGGGSAHLIPLLFLLMTVGFPEAGAGESGEAAGAGFCAPLEGNAELVVDLLRRVDEYHLASRRKDWKRIVDGLMYPDEHPGDRGWKRRQVRIWSKESRFYQETRSRNLLVRQCGSLAVVTTRIWYEEVYPPGTARRVEHTDDFTWWIRHGEQWFTTEEFESILRRNNKSLGGEYEGGEALFVQSPREEFSVVWAAQVEKPE